MPRALPGQFVVIEVEREGVPMRASFSICAIHAHYWVLAIKVARKGGVSEWLNNVTHPERVSVAGPFGEFTLGGGEHHVFIAGGSGITPIFCLMDSLIQQGNVPTLIYFNNAPEEAMYLPELRLLQDRGLCVLVESYEREFDAVLRTVDLKLTQVYLCGPTGLNEAVLKAIERHPDEPAGIHIEHYGVPASTGSSGTVVWKPRWGASKRIELEAGETLLVAAQRQGVGIDSACLVGACKTCKVYLEAGQLDCGGRTAKAGESFLACTARSMNGVPAMVAPVHGLSRPQWFVAAMLAGVAFLALWQVPPGEGLTSQGKMNTGHSNLDCQSCHLPAEGNLRQQLGHNAKTALGWHDHDWKPVGYDPVSNAACQGCHERPNDRHPVSRFEELRFAAQREALGPHLCVNCHGEHTGKRVGLVNMEFCQHCHADLQVPQDPIEPSHEHLAASEAWSTCLTCHDFHGNHVMEVPTSAADQLRESEIQRYFEGGPDPYSSLKQFQAKTND